jgi:hypothetical protein
VAFPPLCALFAWLQQWQCDMCTTFNPRANLLCFICNVGKRPDAAGMTTTTETTDPELARARREWLDLTNLVMNGETFYYSVRTTPFLGECAGCDVRQLLSRPLRACGAG